MKMKNTATSSKIHWYRKYNLISKIFKTTSFTQFSYGYQQKVTPTCIKQLKTWSIKQIIVLFQNRTNNMDAGIQKFT